MLRWLCGGKIHGTIAVCGASYNCNCPHYLHYYLFLEVRLLMRGQLPAPTLYKSYSLKYDFPSDNEDHSLIIKRQITIKASKTLMNIIYLNESPNAGYTQCRTDERCHRMYIRRIVFLYRSVYIAVQVECELNDYIGKYTGFYTLVTKDWNVFSQLTKKLQWHEKLSWELMCEVSFHCFFAHACRC